MHVRMCACPTQHSNRADKHETERYSKTKEMDVDFCTPPSNVEPLVPHPIGAHPFNKKTARDIQHFGKMYVATFFDIATLIQMHIQSCIGAHALNLLMPTQELCIPCWRGEPTQNMTVSTNL